jgi:hypothetical protein
MGVEREAWRYLLRAVCCGTLELVAEYGAWQLDGTSVTSVSSVLVALSITVGGAGLVGNGGEEG